MNIGIITTYRVDNYGTKLQAYAMQSILSEYGNNVCIVDYYPSFDMRIHVLFTKVLRKLVSSFRNMKMSIRKDESQKADIQLQRKQAINSFDKNYILSHKIKGFNNLRLIVDDFDCFVCGSDQIWATGNNITDFFNLVFVNSKKPTIAYAPSFGTSKIPSTFHNSYRSFLNNIDYISVRENSGVAIVKQLTNREVCRVLDPTLLVGKTIWEKLISSNSYPIPTKKYIFCYFLGRNAAHRNYASLLSEKTQCEIVNLAHMKGFCIEDEKLPGKKLYDVSPDTFLKLIKNADYICTDSFHGTVFSVIFKKNFFTFERFKANSHVSTNDRIYSLLNMLGLQDRIVQNKDAEIMQLNTNDINYDIVYEKLQIEQKKSSDFLSDALNKIKRTYGYN